MRTTLIWVGTVIAWVLIFFFLSLHWVGVVAANWDGPNDPKVSSWFASQRNAKGEWCCDTSDGHTFYNFYQMDANGDVEFDADGKHYHLPAYMVLTGPNPTGVAVWWYAETRGGEKISYCFAPGSGS